VASDFLARTRFPVPRDRKVLLDCVVRQGGGPAATAAVALARLGVRVSFAGAVGDDAFGQTQRRELQREGVDVSRVVTVPGRESFACFILVDESDGARTIFSAPATRPLLPESEARLGSPPPHLLLLDGWGGPAELVLAREAARRRIPVLLDAGHRRSQIDALLPLTEAAVVSAGFAAAVAPRGKPERAIQWLLERGPRLAAVTCGERGVWAGAQGEDGLFHVPAFRVARVVDTTGAGDAFHGGTAYGLVTGRHWQESLRLGAAVAALKCRRLGGRDGLPRLAELERFLASS
jgi:sulfofructose kinase